MIKLFVSGLNSTMSIIIQVELNIHHIFHWKQGIDI